MRGGLPTQGHGIQFLRPPPPGRGDQWLHNHCSSRVSKAGKKEMVIFAPAYWDPQSEEKTSGYISSVPSVPQRREEADNQVINQFSVSLSYLNPFLKF